MVGGIVHPPIGSIYHLYIAFWSFICYLPPFAGTRNNQKSPKASFLQANAMLIFYRQRSLKVHGQLLSLGEAVSSEGWGKSNLIKAVAVPSILSWKHYSPLQIPWKYMYVYIYIFFFLNGNHFMYCPKVKTLGN